MSLSAKLFFYLKYLTSFDISKKNAYECFNFIFVD